MGVLQDHHQNRLFKLWNRYSGPLILSLIHSNPLYIYWLVQWKAEVVAWNKVKIYPKGINFWCNMSYIIRTVGSNNKLFIWCNTWCTKILSHQHIGLFLPDFATQLLSFAVRILNCYVLWLQFWQECGPNTKWYNTEPYWHDVNRNSDANQALSLAVFCIRKSGASSYYT